jgi:hypothetical protein
MFVVMFATTVRLEGSDPGLEFLYAVAFAVGVVACLLGVRR